MHSCNASHIFLQRLTYFPATSHHFPATSHTFSCNASHIFLQCLTYVSATLHTFSCNVSHIFLQRLMHSCNVSRICIPALDIWTAVTKTKQQQLSRVCIPTLDVLVAGACDEHARVHGVPRHTGDLQMVALSVGSAKSKPNYQYQRRIQIPSIRDDVQPEPWGTMPHW